MQATNTPRTLHLKPDKATEQRIVWVEQVYAALGLTPAMRRPSVIFRRALEAYCSHLEAMLRREGDPATADLRARFEPSSVERAARGNDLRVSDAALTALPVRPLSDIQADERAAMPKPIEVLRADLMRRTK